MKIETKYNLGQRVFIIADYGYNKRVDCEDCEGIGIVRVEKLDKNVGCPSCYGKGWNYENVPKQWRISESSVKIGKIEVSLYRKRFHKDFQDQIRYMVDETGVGSGSVYYEENIFATLEEAEAACKIRNHENETTKKG